MTLHHQPTSDQSADGAGCPVSHNSPFTFEGPRTPLYTPEFAADPHRHYQEMRERYGSLAPVDVSPGVPATLVVGYRAAIRILNDPEHFPADPRQWQKTVSQESPMYAMLKWRPSAIRNSGHEHTRYRAANVFAISGVDLHALHTVIENRAIPLINSFCGDGEADLVSQYAFPLIFSVLNDLIGCPADVGQQMVIGLVGLFEGTDVENSNRIFEEALSELVQLKRAHPGDDITSRLLAHESEMTNEEMIHQLITLYGGGIEPQLNLIVNTLRLMMTDERFADTLLDGSLSTRAALDEVLFTDPPMANYCFSYPRQPILIDGVWLPAHQAIAISIAAANNDPAIASGDLADNRSHLAWGVGPHACPARSIAYLIVQDAIDQLLDALPEMALAVPAEELSWRTGPFQRALAALPVAFPAAPPLQIGGYR